MPTNEELLKRIEELEKTVEVHKMLIIALSEVVKNIPRPENLAELGRYLALIGRIKP